MNHLRDSDEPSTSQLPLADIRVLDLSRVLAGPLCTMMLGDLGADIIKVERPGSGDDTRGWGPPFDADGQSAYFLAVNRNKLSVTIDLTGEVEVLRTLMQEADVVVENFLPGALERLGVSADEILAAHPRLIWCTISGFGPAVRRPGYDFVVQAETGWMAITGEPEGRPMKAGVAIADLLAGRDAAIAILARLLQRQAPARHRHVVISLADSARAALANVAQNVLVTGADAPRWGNAHANLVPYQLFDASDRALVIAVGTDAQWLACTRALGLDALADDAALRTNAGRVVHRARVIEELQRVLKGHPASEWIRRLTAVGVPCGIVKTVLEAVHEAAGASARTGMPSPVGGSVRFAPPRLGEHDEAIRRLGWRVFRHGGGVD